MKFRLPQFFKRTPKIRFEPRDELKQAKILGFITEEEFLKLKIERAEKELKNYYLINSKKKGKKSLTGEI